MLLSHNSTRYSVLSERKSESVNPLVVCPTLCSPECCIAHQAPLSMEFSRQEYRSRFPFPSPGDLPKPGMEPRSPALQADSLLSGPPGKPLSMIYICLIH